MTKASNAPCFTAGNPPKVNVGRTIKIILMLRVSSVFCNNAYCSCSPEHSLAQYFGCLDLPPTRMSFPELLDPYFLIHVDEEPSPGVGVSSDPVVFCASFPDTCC